MSAPAEWREAADHLEAVTSSLHHDEMPCTDVCRAAARACDGLNQAAAMVEQHDRSYRVWRIGELRVERDSWRRVAERLQEGCDDIGRERQSLLAELADLRRIRDGLRDLIELSHKISPSQAMTIYRRDLEALLAGHDLEGQLP